MNYSNSLKRTIYNYLKSKYPESVHKGEIGKKAIEWGYENENAGRRCRELCKEGYIERELVKSLSGPKCVIYRWKPPVVIEQSPEERVRELAQMGIF
jgi:hypothetical protein